MQLAVNVCSLLAGPGFINIYCRRWGEESPVNRFMDPSGQYNIECGPCTWCRPSSSSLVNSEEVMLPLRGIYAQRVEAYAADLRGERSMWLEDKFVFMNNTRIHVTSISAILLRPTFIKALKEHVYMYIFILYRVLKR